MPPTPAVCLLFVDLQGVFSLWSLLYGSVLHAFLGGEYLGTSRLHPCLSECTSVHAQQSRTCMHMIIAYRHIYLHMHACTFTCDAQMCHTHAHMHARMYIWGAGIAQWLEHQTCDQKGLG